MTSKSAEMYANMFKPAVLQNMAVHAQYAALSKSVDMTEEERKRFADLEAAIMNILELQG
jgi:DNA-binding protein